MPSSESVAGRIAELQRLGFVPADPTVHIAFAVAVAVLVLVAVVVRARRVEAAKEFVNTVFMFVIMCALLVFLATFVLDLGWCMGEISQGKPTTHCWSPW